MAFIGSLPPLQVWLRWIVAKSSLLDSRALRPGPAEHFHWQLQDGPASNRFARAIDKPARKAGASVLLQPPSARWSDHCRILQWLLGLHEHQQPKHQV